MPLDNNPDHWGTNPGHRDRFIVFRDASGFRDVGTNFRDIRTNSRAIGTNSQAIGTISRAIGTISRAIGTNSRDNRDESEKVHKV